MYCTLKFVYDSLNKLNPVQFHTYYNYPIHNYNTDAMRNLNLNLPTIWISTYGLKSLKYTGCMLWNNLSFADRSVKSKNVFSRILKNHMTDAYDNQWCFALRLNYVTWLRLLNRFCYRACRAASPSSPPHTAIFYIFSIIKASERQLLMVVPPSLLAYQGFGAL